MIPRIHVALKWVLILPLVLSIFACSESKTVEQYQADIDQYLSKKDYNSALVALKNAVKSAPKNASFRYHLAAVYLNQGDYLSAEKEFTIAQKLGFDLAQILPKLIEVKFKLNQHNEVYQLAKDAQNLADNDYVIALTYAGLSALHQGKREEAQAYIDEANQISSESIYGQIGKAYLAQTQEDVTASIEAINSVIEYAPDIAETYLLKGYLLQGVKRYSEAAKAFEIYSKKRPKELQTQFFVAQNYVYAKALTTAEPIVDNLLKILPKHPLTNQLKAQIAFDLTHYQDAREYAMKAYQIKNSLTISHIIAGMSSYYLGDYQQAYKQLKPIKPRLPNDHIVHKFLLELQLRLGYGAEASVSINEIIDQDQVDSALLTATSFGLLTIGNKKDAELALDKSIALSQGTSQEFTQQGIMKIRLDDIETGIEMLQKAIELDPQSQQAEAGLAYGYLYNIR